MRVTRTLCGASPSSGIRHDSSAGPPVLSDIVCSTTVANVPPAGWTSILNLTVAPSVSPASVTDRSCGNRSVTRAESFFVWTVRVLGVPCSTSRLKRASVTTSGTPSSGA